MTVLRQPLHKIRTGLCWLEDAALVAVLLTILGLAVYQIILRNVMGYSLPWIDPLNRVGVLWIALLGSMVGARRNNHIKIDLAVQWLPPALAHWVQRLVALMSAVALALISWHTWRLVEDERAWGASSLVGIETWQLQLIMPLAFAVMAVRYASMVIRPITRQPPTLLPGETVSSNGGNR